MRDKFTFLKVLFLCCFIQATSLICDAQVVPGVGAYTEDPKKILMAAEQVVGNLRRVTYEATFESVGSFATRGSMTVGKIKLAKLEAGNPLTAKVAAEGKSYPAGRNDAETFKAAFTGTTIFRLYTDKKILMRKVLTDTDPKERDFGFVTGLLGAGANDLMMFEYLLTKPFARLIIGQVIEYEGRAAVGGVLCHVIYAEFDKRPDGRIRKQRWFIGINDKLPRKVETLSADDKGRHGGYTLTLSNLRAEAPLSPQTFSIVLPQGYKIKDYEPTKRPEPLAVGEIAPEWKLTDYEGKTHTLSDYKGKVVVLDFWATWCAPCVKTMPEIQALHEKYKDLGVKVFGVNTWEEGNSVAYFKEKNYSYGLLLNGETITKSYRVSNLPVIYVIGVGGEVIYQSNVPDSNLANVIEQYLKERGV
jgi:thiol-disulfide isomerase/thioredoxin